jgi:hypothetical protein
MDLITATMLMLALGGGEQPQTPRVKFSDRLSTSSRPLASTTGRPLASVGTDRALASTGTDRALISTGTDRGLASTGTDRALVSTGRFRPLTRAGRDRALEPTGGLEEQPPAPSGELDGSIGGSVNLGGSVAPGGAMAPAGAGTVVTEGGGVPASVTSGAAPASTRAPSRFAGMLTEAKEAMSARDFSRAEQLLYSVRTADLSSWDARLRYASNLVALGHYDRSLTELTAALKAKSKDEALPATTELFGSTEVFNEIQQQLKEYRSHSAGDPQATLLDAMLEGLAGHQPQAASLIGEARELHPGWEPIDLIERATAPPAAHPENATPRPTAP